MADKIISKNTAIDFPESSLLISKTDPQGKITYCNAEFTKVSGYSESELLGKPHNIIRHPDTPKVIFRLFWQALKSNREFNGYIKNKTKNNNYYWVFANVTPSFSSENELLGYYSVRRKPEPEKLNYVQNLYADLLDIEDSSTASDVTDDSLYKLNSILNAREKGYEEFILTI